MRLTRRGEYALRAMLELAEGARRAEGALVRSQDIAEHQEIPPKFLPQIVNELSRAGFIATVRGASGGVRLARPASEITVAEVIETVEGPLALNECLLDQQPCRRKEGCALAPMWEKAQQALMGVLANTTLEELSAMQLTGPGGAR